MTISFQKLLFLWDRKSCIVNTPLSSSFHIVADAKGIIDEKTPDLLVAEGGHEGIDLAAVKLLRLLNLFRSFSFFLAFHHLELLRSHCPGGLSPEE